MRKAILSLAMVFMLPAALLAMQNVAVSDYPEAVSARVLESDVSRTVLEYDIGTFSREPVEIGGEAYSLVSLGDESRISEKGMPALPNICRSIVVPDDAEMTVRVVSSHYVEYPDFAVAPSKGVLTRNIDPATVPYTFNPFYDTDDWFPERLAYAREPYIMRDVRGVVVVVNPFQYNPGTGTLRVYDRVVVEVTATGPGRVNVLKHRPSDRSSEFEKIYEEHFLNYSPELQERYPSLGETGNMLVICYDDAAFLSAMQPFVEWKNQMGVPCEMVTTTDAGGTAKIGRASCRERV